MSAWPTGRKYPTVIAKEPARDEHLSCQPSLQHSIKSTPNIPPRRQATRGVDDVTVCLPTTWRRRTQTRRLRCIAAGLLSSLRPARSASMRLHGSAATGDVASLRGARRLLAVGGGPARAAGGRRTSRARLDSPAALPAAIGTFLVYYAVSCIRLSSRVDSGVTAPLERNWLLRRRAVKDGLVQRADTPLPRAAALRRAWTSDAVAEQPRLSIPIPVPWRRTCRRCCACVADRR
jgi:hypothetical protein